MKRGLQITLAVMAGYVLGRQRRLRAAMLLGAAAAAGRFSGNPADLLARGRKVVGSSSALGELSGLARPLVDAGRAAARAGVSELLLPHIPPWTSREDVISEAKAEFDGPVHAVVCNETFEVSRS